MYHRKHPRRLNLAAAVLLAAPFSWVHGTPLKTSEIADWSVSHASQPQQINLVADGYLGFIPPTGPAVYDVTGGSAAVVVSNTDELITFTYDQGAIGPGTVKIAVTDVGGTVVYDPFTITVTNAAPVENAGIADETGWFENPSDQNFSVSTAGAFMDGDWAAPGSSETVTLTAVVADPSLVTWDGNKVLAGGDLGFTIRADQHGSTTVTVTATDKIGATGITQFTITVTEVNEPPALDPIGDQEVDEGSTLSFSASAKDLDEPPDVLTYSLDAGAPAGATINAATGDFDWTPSEAQGPGIYPVTIRVTDDGAPILDDFETIAITVNEVNEAPVLGVIGDRSVDEGALLAFTASATDEDLPANGLTYSLDPGAPEGASIDPLSGVFSWTPTETDEGTHNVTIRVTDDGSPTQDDSESIQITVNEVNEAPVLGAIGDQTVDELTPLNFVASATDADVPANDLTYSLDPGAPAGAAIDPVSGAFSWTPTEADEGTHVVTVRVTDDGTPSLDDVETISITVNEVNVAPVLNPVGDQLVDELATLSFVAGGADADLPADNLTYSLDPGAPAGAGIDPVTGAFSWTPTEADGPGAYPVTIRLTDDGTPTLDDFETITITVNEVNEPPVLAAVGDRTLDELTTLDFSAGATDPDLPVNGLTYSLDPGAPAGASIDPLSGAFGWTPAENQDGLHSITVRVTDDGTPALDDFETITITVNEANEPPVLGAIGDQTIDEGQWLTFTAAATDPDLPANNLTYTLDPGAPAGAAIDPVTGVFGWTPVEADGPGSYLVTIRVTDDGTGNLEDLETITITVNEANVAPVLNPVGVQLVDELVTLNFAASGADADLPANNLTYSLDPGAPAGAAIDPVTGAFSWTPTEADGPGMYPVTIRLTDDGTPTLDDFETITITVNEVNEPPVLGAIGDQAIDEGSLLSVTATATDPDTPANAFTYTLDAGAPAGAAIDPVTGIFTWTPAESQEGPHSITVRVTDDGTPALDDFETITVTVSEVNEAPVLAAIGDRNIDEETPLSFSAVATDVDTPANTLSYSLDPGAPGGASIDPATGAFSWTPAEADGPGSFPVTIRVTDDGTPSLDDSETITITVNEINDPPSLVGDVLDQTMDEDEATRTVQVRSEFDDADLGDTPPDVLNVVVLPGYDASLATVTVNGSAVDVTPLPHRYGMTTVTVGVEDKGGIQATDTFLLTVNSVNDPVEVAGGVSDQGAPEDVGMLSIPLTGAFSDADLENGGDTHTVTFTSSNTTLLVPTNSPLNDLSGTMSFAVTPNENGIATITVTAEDAAGSRAVTTFDISIAEVNDPPFVANPLSDLSHAEDAGPLAVDFSTTFDDPDLGDGDVQNFSVSVDNGTLVTSATITGTNLDLVFGEHQNGIVNVTLNVQDNSGNMASDTFFVEVKAVNDDPSVASPIADITTFEDDPADIVIDLSNVFFDPDVATNGDVLTFSLVSNDNSGLFDLEDLTGSILTLSLAFDQNGVANIVVRAQDSTGATATDAFVLTVTPVNDLPVANDDTAMPILEDSGPVTIAVLDNDYLAEQPTVIISAGDDGQSEGDRPYVLDPFGDPVQLDAGSVTIIGNEIAYEPAPNFFGTDYFTYEIEDSDGDRAEATVTISVQPTNDAPVGIQERTFNMFENGTLSIDAANGALVGAYDVDGALLDASGNPVGSPVSAVITVPPTVGSLAFDQATGAFEYVPPINFTGEASFFYRLFDGVDLSGGTDYEIRVIVNATPPPPALPNPGQVAINYNVANVPLDQTASVPPNVMVVMDDSGSMDWNVVVYGADENGGIVLDNSARTRGKRANTSSYVYLWDLTTNAYPAASQFGLVLPTDEALAAADGGGTRLFDGHDYGLWRARTHLHNRLYYNPDINYRPWTGQDANNVEFADANPSAIRLNPVDPTNTFDMLALHSYVAGQVPEWDNNGGTTAVDVVDLYIPHYYTVAVPPPLPADPLLAGAAKVEIIPGNTYVGGPGREDCADPMACTYAEEIRNFANWFQYYRNREYVTKGSIGNVIARVQDIRIGYETISATTSAPVRHMNDLYTEGNKKLLLDNVYAVDSYGGTPLRQALGRAGKIFACQTGNDCPALPAPDGQCQQNYALLFTDGYWNGGAGVPGNDDIDGPGVFDGGRYEDGVNATLGDVAMFYYENDLQPGLDDEVPVARNDLIGVPSGTFSGDNDTMHQHMKTYAIAFGVSGTFDPATVPLDPTTPFAWTDPFSGPREKIDDLVHAATNGRGRFLNASDPRELQKAFDAAFLEFTQSASSASAAAFNSTSLRIGTLLYRGFYDLRDNTGELTATIVNSDGSLAPSPTWRASELLNPSSLLPDNRTIVTSDPISGDGIPFRFGSLGASQQLMMSEAEVNYIRGDRSNEALLLRERPAVDGLLGDIVNSSPVFVGAPGAINRDQAPYPEDDLYSSFALAKQSRTPIVYVGANDGILHGFDAELGVERFGYVPNKIIDAMEPFHNDLDEFTSPFYQHKYYVDLTPSINDVYMRPARGVTGKEWITMMLGGLGGGGKGFFALNVTNPDTQFTSEANAAASSVLWEFTDEDDTYPVDASGNPIGGGTWLDPDGRPVKDLGLALSQPTLTLSNVTDGGAPVRHEWVAIFGNGLNSTAGIAKLFVLFLDRGVDGWQSGDFVKVDTGVGVPIAPAPRAGYPNGLGSVTAVDVDLNGTVDWVYGGDRLGNLYRFDLSDPDPANWTSTLLFTATYTDGSGNTTIQPILSKPLVSKHPTEAGFLVTVGTGSHVAREDNRSRDIQSIYTIWDRGEANPATAQGDTKALRLVEQVITNVVDDSVSPFVTRRIVTDNPVDYQSEGATPGTYGWYVDLDMPRATSTVSGGANPDGSGQAPPAPQFPGEKAIRRMILRDGNIIATTVLPSGSGASCFGSRPGSILLLNALSGGNPSFPVVDFNNDGYVDNGDLVTVGDEDFAAGILFDQDALDGSLTDPSILGGEGDTDFLFLSGGSETISFRIGNVNDGRTGRLSWQELN